MITKSAKDKAWRIGSIVVFCGLPLLLLGISVLNMMQTAESHDLSVRQQTILTQIIAKLATRRSHAMTAEDTASLYLDSATPSLARAEIQARATKLVDAAAGHLVESQPNSTPEQEEDGTVVIQLALDIDNKGLRDLLYMLEAGLPLLDVTQLSARTGTGQDEAQADPNAVLHVDMTVQGHFRKSGE